MESMISVLDEVNAWNKFSVYSKIFGDLSLQRHVNLARCVSRDCHFKVQTLRPRSPSSAKRSISLDDVFVLNSSMQK